MNSNLSPVEISIRKMELTDIDRVSEIDHISFSLPWPKSSFLFEIQENTLSRSWVAELSSSTQKITIAGFLVTWLIIDELHIASLATDPEFRHLKIALRLMVHSLCSAAREGALISLLEVRRGNQAARSLYQKLGYIEDGVRQGYYQNNHEDAILMSLPAINSDLLKSLV
ncbi:MAG: ribosomal protein S18-alanine N-acetyltransferase [Anaerolineaceae bacterium]